MFILHYKEAVLQLLICSNIKFEHSVSLIKEKEEKEKS
jgi:hypothetical protein